MPRKNNSQPQTKERKKRATVNATHSIKFTAPTIVEDPSIVTPEDEDVEVEAEEAGALMDFEEEDDAGDIEVEVKRPPTVKQKLRAKFTARGIGGSEELKLRIDRMPTYGQDGLAGVRTDKQFCGVVTCNDSYFDNDNYLIRIQQSYGPGDYWLTLRHKNTIVQQWVESVGGFPVAQAVSENGQPSPTIINYQPPNQAGPQAPDTLGQLRGALRLVKDFREDLGLVMPQAATSQAPPALDAETAFLQGLAHDDKFMDRIRNGTLKHIFGDKAAPDDEPGFAAIAMKMVETGQADKAINAVANFALKLADRILPNWGNHNGSSQMGAQAIQDQGPANAGQQDISLSSVQGGPHAALQQGDGGSTGRQVDGAYTAANASAYQNLSPQQQALMILFDDCRMKLPPQIAYDKLMDLAEAVYDQAPAYSLYPYLTYFGDMTIDDALEFVKTQPGGEEVAALPHACVWTEEVQRLIKESRIEDDEA